MDKPFGLNSLGSRSETPAEPSARILEAFDNPRPELDYVVRLDCPEFTSMCPVTGQSDFGRFVIDYCPAARCAESKSLKLYLASFRQTGCFWEDLSGRIAGDLQTLLEPRWLRLTGYMAVRGGIRITTVVTLGDAELAEKMLTLMPTE